MTQLAPIELEDGTVIYMEATEKVDAPEIKEFVKQRCFTPYPYVLQTSYID